MIYKNYLLVLFICIPNINAAKKAKETIQLTYESSLTKIETDIYIDDDTERSQNIQDKSSSQETSNKKESLDNSNISDVDLLNRNDVRNTENRFCESDQIQHTNFTKNGILFCLEENQTYTVDKCRDGTLNKPCQILVNNVSTKCVQKYMTVKLRAYECDKPTQINVVDFEIPSCCMCKLHNSPERRRRHTLRQDYNKQDKRNAGGINSDIAYPKQINGSSSNITCIERFGSLCIRVKDYPKDVIANLKKNKAFEDLKMFFGTDESRVELSSRSGSETGNDMLCEHGSRIIDPKSGFNVQNVEKFIVQDEEDTKTDLKQEIWATECKNPGKPCIGMDNKNYIATCTQEYILRNMVVLDKNTLLPAVESMKIPSCCACHLKSTSETVEGVYPPRK